MSTAAPPNASGGELDAKREPVRADATATDQVALQPRWLWITFALVALAVPAVGFWLERVP